MDSLKIDSIYRDSNYSSEYYSLNQYNISNESSFPKIVKKKPFFITGGESSFSQIKKEKISIKRARLNKEYCKNKKFGREFSLNVDKILTRKNSISNHLKNEKKPKIFVTDTLGSKEYKRLHKIFTKKEKGLNNINNKLNGLPKKLDYTFISIDSILESPKFKPSYNSSFQSNSRSRSIYSDDNNKSLENSAVFKEFLENEESIPLNKVIQLERRRSFRALKKLK